MAQIKPLVAEIPISFFSFEGLVFPLPFNCFIFLPWLLSEIVTNKKALYLLTMRNYLNSDWKAHYKCFVYRKHRCLSFGLEAFFEKCLLELFLSYNKIKRNIVEYCKILKYLEKYFTIFFEPTKINLLLLFILKKMVRSSRNKYNRGQPLADCNLSTKAFFGGLRNYFITNCFV